jgi:AcrR family transcriptional regulator
MRPAVDHGPAILKAAARLFAEKPFHLVRMDEVASRARVAKGTIYRFYPDKDELYVAIIAAWLTGLKAELRSVALARRPAPERLREMVAKVVAHHHARRDFYEVMRREEADRRLLRRPEIRARHRAIRRLLARVIREGQLAGELCAIEPQRAAIMLLGMVLALLRFGDRRLSSGETARMALGVFLHGLARGRNNQGCKR